MYTSDTDGFLVKNMWIYAAKEEIPQVHECKFTIRGNDKHQKESVKKSLYMYVT